MTPDELRALAEQPIDLDAVAMQQMRQAAAESTWMPAEYTSNDWIADVCKCLRDGPPAAAPQAEPPQVFTRWVRDNMPPNTVISDPDWWAAQLWRAAMRAHGIGGSDAE